MENHVSLKLYNEADALFIVSLYNYYVRETTSNFHTDEMDVEDVETFFQIRKNSTFFRCIWVERKIQGFVAIKPINPKPAYFITGEISLYLSKEAGGKGWGSQVMKLLETEAPKLGYHSLVGILCAENQASMALFEKMNYQRRGHLCEVGQKFGRLLDVYYYQKILPQENQKEVG